jgi:hypothetical protein
MNYAKYFKVELSLGETLRKTWEAENEEKKHLDDKIIDGAIHAIISTDDRFGYISSINIAVALTKPDIEQALRALNVPIHPWKVLIIIMNGGSHWSCMMYVKKNNTAYYYDSIQGFHINQCKIVYKLMRKLQVFDKNTKISERLFLQQESTFECGYYLLGAVLLARMYFEDEIPIDVIRNTEEYKNNVMMVLFDYLGKSFME